MYCNHYPYIHVCSCMYVWPHAHDMYVNHVVCLLLLQINHTRNVGSWNRIFTQRFELASGSCCCHAKSVNENLLIIGNLVVICFFHLSTFFALQREHSLFDLSITYMMKLFERVNLRFACRSKISSRAICKINKTLLSSILQNKLVPKLGFHAFVL